MNFSFYQNNIKIVVDKRTIVLSIVEILSEYKEKYVRFENYFEQVFIPNLKNKIKQRG